MNFPKELSRITKHKKPRHQLYQPGFNPSNSCWLKGEWITLSEDEWRARKDEHERMYARIHTDKQHHRGGPTPLEDMTPAQRQAWKSFSGNKVIEGRHANGAVGPYSAGFAGDRLHPGTLAHMRKIGWKACRRCRLYSEGAVIEQAETFHLPDDILLDEEDAPDVTAEVVKQNRQASTDVFQGCLNGDSTSSFGQFQEQMAIQYLLEAEEEIIWAEWDASRGEPDPYTDLDEARARYAEMRKQARDSLGDRFDEAMARSRASHNSCARANLDNGDGQLFDFVLPEFHDDGSHEPVGEHDVS